MVRTQHKAGVSGRFRHGYLIILTSETRKKSLSTLLGSNKQVLARASVPGEGTTACGDGSGD